MPLSLSIVTLALLPLLSKLLNSSSKFAPLSKYKVELLTKFKTGTLDIVNNSVSYSFSLSVAPLNINEELLIVTSSHLWIDILSFGESNVP